MSIAPHPSHQDDDSDAGTDQGQRPDRPEQPAQQVREDLTATLDQSRTERHRQATQSLRRTQREVRRMEGHDDRIVGVETQVLIDGEPVTVSELARQQPGETTAATAARAETIGQQHEDPRLEVTSRSENGPDRRGVGIG